MSGCPYQAAMRAADTARPSSLLTRLAARLRPSVAHAEAEVRLLQAPAAARRPRLAAALGALGRSATAWLNNERFDVRLGRHQLNPIRIGHDVAEIWYGGVDPNLPREYFGVLGAIFRGVFNTANRAPHFDQTYRANKARAQADAAAGVPVNPYTPDGDTWVYTVPNMPLIRFHGDDAVDTGFDDNPGLLMPVYCVKGQTALKAVFTEARFDRGPVPYHLLAQAVGSSTLQATDDTAAAGLFAGRTQNNRTWKNDRRLGLRLVGPKALDQLRPGMLAALHDVRAELDEHIALRPDEPVDATVMMSRIAYRMIIRAAIGDVDDQEFNELGRALTEPVRDVLAHVMQASNGYLTDKAGFVASIRTCKRLFGEIGRIVRRLHAQGRLSAEQTRSPLIDFVLTGGDDGTPPDDDRLFTLLMPVIFGGHETTGFTLSWAVLELARDPGLEQRYLAELAAFQADHRDGIRPGLYTERPVQQALLYEIGRRYPPVFAVPRTAGQAGVMPPDPDTGIGAFRYPAGALFLAEISAVHMDPDLYPDPQRFDIDRFLPPQPMQRAEAGRWTRKHMARLEKNFRYLLFGAGPAKCLGQPFNQLEFNLVLDELLPRYRFELVDPEREVRQTNAPISGPEAGSLAVRIRTRPPGSSRSPS